MLKIDEKTIANARRGEVQVQLNDLIDDDDVLIAKIKGDIPDYLKNELAEHGLGIYQYQENYFLYPLDD